MEDKFTRIARARGQTRLADAASNRLIHSGHDHDLRNKLSEINYLMHRGVSRSREPAAASDYPEKISITLSKVAGLGSQRPLPFMFTDTSRDHAIAMEASDTDPESGATDEEPEAAEWERLKLQVRQSDKNLHSRAPKQPKAPINLYKDRYELPKKLPSGQPKDAQQHKHLPLPEKKPSLADVHARHKENNRNINLVDPVEHADDCSRRAKTGRGCLQAHQQKPDSDHFASWPKEGQAPAELDPFDPEYSFSPASRLRESVRLAEGLDRQTGELDGHLKKMISHFTISVESMLEDMRQLICQKNNKISQLQSWLKSINISSFTLQSVDDTPLLNAVDPLLQQSQRIRRLVAGLTEEPLEKKPDRSLQASATTEPVLPKHPDKLTCGVFDYLTSKLLNHAVDEHEAVLRDLKKHGYSDRLKMLDRAIQMQKNKHETMADLYREKFMSENIIITSMQHLLVLLAAYLKSPSQEKLSKLSRANIEVLQEELQRMREANERAILESGGVVDREADYAYAVGLDDPADSSREAAPDEESSALDRLDQMRRQRKAHSSRNSESSQLRLQPTERSGATPRESLKSTGSQLAEADRDLLQMVISQTKVLEKYVG